MKVQKKEIELLYLVLRKAKKLNQASFGFMNVLLIYLPHGIYEIKTGNLEVYKLIGGSYSKMQPNAQGRYLIEPLQVELGLWSGTYQNQTQLWLRWWDTSGNMLLIGSERAEMEREHAETERIKLGTRALNPKLPNK